MRKGAQETVCSTLIWKQLNIIQDKILGKSDIIIITSPLTNFLCSHPNVQDANALALKWNSTQGPTPHSVPLSHEIPFLPLNYGYLNYGRYNVACTSDFLTGWWCQLGVSAKRIIYTMIDKKQSLKNSENHVYILLIYKLIISAELGK